MQSVRKYTQQLDGFQVVREDLIVEGSAVGDLSKLEQLSVRRRRQSEIRIHVARIDLKYKCPKCGNIHTRSYVLREKTIDGVPDAFIPVKIIVTVHRLYCPDCGEMWAEEIPFVNGPKSHMTKTLARTIIALRSEMSIKAISEAFGLSWGRVKKVEKDQLAKDYARIPLNKVEALTIDEICVFHTGPAEKKFMTVVRDAKTGDVLYIGDGKGVKALKGFEKRLRHWRRRIKYVCMDMSNSYAKWVRDFLGEKTDIVYDHFHLIKAMNDRLDKVRRRTMNRLGGEYKKILKGQRHTLKKNMEKLNEKERGHLDEMRGTFSELSDVHSMKEQLRGIYTFAEYETGARWLLEDWCETARMTAVHELVTMAQTITDHMEGILGYWRYGKACNSGAEGFNTKIRWLIKQAFGYRDRAYLKLKIYALPDTEINRSL